MSATIVTLMVLVLYINDIPKALRDQMAHLKANGGNNQ